MPQLVSSLVAAFTVPGEPRPKERPRVVKKGPRIITYTPLPTREAEKRIGDIFQEEMPGYAPDPDARYGVRLLFAYWSKRKHDIDNMQKLVLDALNHKAFCDDDQVFEVTACKLQVPRDQARTEITIYRLMSEELPDGRVA